MRGLQAEGGALQWREIPDLGLSDGQVRIRVQAAGLNRADLLQKAGMYPPPAGVTKTLGLECAGEVVEVMAIAAGPWATGFALCSQAAAWQMRWLLMAGICWRYRRG